MSSLLPVQICNCDESTQIGKNTNVRINSETSSTGENEHAVQTFQSLTNNDKLGTNTESGTGTALTDWSMWKQSHEHVLEVGGRQLAAEKLWIET